MPRFVVLAHDQPTPHYDFLLEQGEILKAWRLEQAPARGLRILATANADHRRIYLEFEGPVSGERGQVRRVAEGEFEWLTPTRIRFVAGELVGAAEFDGVAWRFEA